MRDRGESSSLNSVADESEPTQQDQKHEEVGGPQAVNDQNETRVSPRAGIVRGKRVMTLGEDEGMETSINALAGNEVELIANLLNKALGLSKTDLVNIIKETVKCRGSTSKAMAMAMAMAMAFNIISPKDKVGGNETLTLSENFDESRSSFVSRVQITAGLREEDEKKRGLLSQPVANGNDIRNVTVDMRQPQSYHSGNEDGQPHRELGSAQRSSTLCVRMGLATTPTDRGYKEMNFQPGRDGNPQRG
ncbi:hypothetical protein MRB53_033864 [Persea americana]|uniref:Uncharacterized protein n=1 Tax=Persea americana TaxID=3435 RepID=A0ACC2KX41_PERAE|nr:hypothetical protein MRB53_033864 [Persea americana]